MCFHFQVDLQTDINNGSFVDALNENLGESTDIDVESVSTPEEVVATVEIIVDASDVTDTETPTDNIETVLEDTYDFDNIDSEQYVVTSAPTAMPTSTPSASPLTSIPTAMPSISGSVTTVVASMDDVTQEISDAIIADSITDLANNYGVSADNITASVTYETSGVITIDTDSIPEDMTEEELEEIIISSLAEELDLHESNIAVDVDLETGEITYTISSDELTDVQEAQFDLESEQTQEEIMNSIEQDIPGSDVTGVTVEPEIDATVEFIIDTDEAENDLVQAEYESQQSLAENFDNVDIETDYVTYAPSFIPSIPPTTSIPTAQPSITGVVSIISMSQTPPANGSLTEEELQNMTTTIATAYGVDEDDVEIIATYTTSGTFDLVLNGSVDTDALEDSLEDEIAELLGIHESEVEVIVSENGTVYYVITSDSAEEAEDYQTMMGNDTVPVTIYDGLTEDTQFVNVSSISEEISVDENITVEIDIVVDVNEAENNLEDAASAVEEIFSEENYETEADNVFITSAPTLFPSVVPTELPTTAIPTAQPSITGEIWSVEITGTVNESLSDEEVTDMQAEVAAEFGVDENDVDVDVEYVASGSITIDDIPDDMSEEDLENILIDSLSEALDIHESNIEIISIDEETGEVIYEVSSSNYTEIAEIQDNMDDDTEFMTELNSALAQNAVDTGYESDSLVTNNVDTESDEIEVEIIITVDSTDSPLDLTDEDAANLTVALVDIVDDYVEQNVTVDVIDNLYITSTPTFSPSTSPVTGIPTQTPTITGTVVVVEIVVEQVTGDLTEEEMENLESVVKDSYGIDDDEYVAVDVEYVSSGTITMSNIPDDMTEDEIVDHMTDVLAQQTGVDESDIVVVVDLDTGVVTYEISSETYTDAADIQSVLDAENTEDVINSYFAANEETADLVVDDIESNDSIDAQVSVVMDEDEVDENLQVAENIVDITLGDGYTVSSGVTTVTSAPTFIPSVVPSQMPSSSIPSARPTITGEVVIIDLTTQVSDDLTTEEINEIIEDVEEEFDIYPGNVDVEVTYETSGTIALTLDENVDIDSEELEQALEESIAEILDIHVSDVNVEIDPETGDITYTITAENYDDSVDIQAQLQDPAVIASLNDAVSEDVAGISDVSVTPEYGVDVHVELIIDSTDATDINGSLNNFTETYADEWDNVAGESVFIISAPTTKPTAAPIMQPTTSIPSAQPTITGLIVNFELSTVATDDLTPEEISNLSALVMDAYNVTEEDISTEVIYSVTGELELDNIPDDVTSEELEDAVIESIAEELGVHPKDVEIESIDMDSGVVIYTVSSDNYNATDAVMDSMEELDISNVEDNLQDYIPGIEIVSSDLVSDDVVVSIEYVVDVSDPVTEVDLNAAEDELIDNMIDSMTVSDVTVEIITAKPSVSPTFTTMIPTQQPSITGIVVVIEISKAGESLNTTELDDLTEEIAADYGVDPTSVDIEESYTFSGSLDIDDLPEDLSEDELEELLEQSIADSVGLHVMNVDVNVDSETGEVTYTITVDDESIAADTQAIMDSVDYVDTLNTEVVETASELNLPEESVPTVSEVEVEEQIVMDLSITVDANESEEDVDDVTQSIVDQYEQDGYDTDSDMNIITSVPTIAPIIAPTTSLPTAQPSMTGVIVEISGELIVEESIPEEDLEAIEAQVMEEFNVDADQVSVDVTYSSEGSMIIDVPANTTLTEEQIEQEIAESISEELGIHISDVNVDYDPETGDVIYVIYSDDAESLVFSFKNDFHVTQTTKKEKQENKFYLF